MSGRHYLRRGLLGVGWLGVVVATALGQAPQPLVPTGTTAPATPGASQAVQPGGAVKSVATVNGKVVTEADLDLVVKAQGPSPVPVPEKALAQMRMHALAVIINDILVDQYMQAHGPEIPQAEVDKKLAELAAGLKEKGKTLADYCRETHQTEAQLRLDVYRKMQFLAFADARIGDKQLREHFDAYKDWYDQASVRVSHIALKVPAQASDADKVAARQKLTDLRKQILDGKLAFAEAAKAQSQCPSAPKGGDLGPIARKYMVEEPFARAAFSLQPNQISDIVQTDYGLHLILCTARDPGKPKEFEAIKETVREFCITDLREAILAQQRKASKVEINLP